MFILRCNNCTLLNYPVYFIYELLGLLLLLYLGYYIITYKHTNIIFIIYKAIYISASIPIFPKSFNFFEYFFIITFHYFSLTNHFLNVYFFEWQFLILRSELKIC